MTYWNIFGLDVAQAGYQGSILPILVIALILATIEKLLQRHLKVTVDFILTPLIKVLLNKLLFPEKWTAWYISSQAKSVDQ